VEKSTSVKGYLPMTKDRRGNIGKLWCRPARQAGFSLIEAMVAAAILAAGVLALAGMQGVAFTKNGDANELVQVTTLNADIMERIKFNRGRALDYNGINTGNPATQPPATRPMARGDYAQWQTMLTRSRLANAVGTVTVARLDPDPAFNPTTLNQFQVNVMINWTTQGLVRNRAVTFTSVVAPE
jgi:type IV pilus modification protein PilV